MKSIFLILGLTLVTVCEAQFIAHITIYNEDNQAMTVYLDGEKRNNEPASRVRIINLREPYYKLKIVFADSSIEPVERKMLLLQDSKGYPVDVTYRVKKSKKGFYKIHFMSQTIYPGYINPPKEKKEEKATLIEANTKTHCTTISLSDSSFATAIQSLENVSSESVKVMLLKQLLQTNCVSAEQVKRFLEKISAETDKLELAKFAYNSTVDKGNYVLLNSLFKDEKSIEELYQSILKK